MLNSYTAKISSKGQVVIPKPIRDKLKLGQNITLTFTVLDDGFKAEPIPDLSTFFMSVKKVRTDISEKEAIEQAVIEKYLKKLEDEKDDNS